MTLSLENRRLLSHFVIQSPCVLTAGGNGDSLFLAPIENSISERDTVFNISEK